MADRKGFQDLLPQHPLAPDPTTADDGFEHVKPVARVRLSEADVSHDIDGVSRLLEARSFREAASLSSQLLMVTAAVADPRDRLLLRSMKVVALGSAGMAQEALAEVETLGDLDAIDAPFVLRFAKVQLAAITRATRGTEGLYDLLSWCSRGAAAAQTPEERSVWETRECYCLSAIAARHVQSQEFAFAIETLEAVVERRPTDPAVLSDIGRAYLLIGGLSQAAAFFREADKFAPGGDSSKSAMCLMNAAFLKLAQEQFTPAVELFNSARGRDGRSALANNMAVAWVFNGNLVRALATFREAVSKDPSGIEDALVGNLCIMYDLTSDTADKKKAELLSFIKRNSIHEPPALAPISATSPQPTTPVAHRVPASPSRP